MHSISYTENSNLKKQILENLQNLRHGLWPQWEKLLFTKLEDEQKP